MVDRESAADRDAGADEESGMDRNAGADEESAADRNAGADEASGVERKRRAARSFGAAADAYLESDVHRRGADLDRLADWCRNADRALDVATGAGHTAGALVEAGVPDVVATDASPEMIATAAVAYEGVRVAVADAERLPFADETFDAVACRIAAHHFPDPRSFVAESARVLRPGGTIAFEDTVAPSADVVARVLHEVERTRDPSHVESHPVERWLTWFVDAGFEVLDTRRFRTTLSFDEWLGAQSVGPEARRHVESTLLDAPEPVRAALDVEIEGGRVRSFTNRKALVRAERRD